MKEANNERQTDETFDSFIVYYSWSQTSDTDTFCLLGFHSSHVNVDQIKSDKNLWHFFIHANFKKPRRNLLVISKVSTANVDLARASAPVIHQPWLASMLTSRDRTQLCSVKWERCRCGSARLRRVRIMKERFGLGCFSCGETWFYTDPNPPQPDIVMCV